MKLTYVSGPMTGLPEYNHPAFHAKAAELRAMGYPVVNPAELIPYNPFAPELSGEQADAFWRHCMSIDIAALAGCDRIVMLDGWTRSRGAQLEHQIARALGIEIVECGKAVVS